MSTTETRPHAKFVRGAKTLGITALAAATIGGYALYSRGATDNSLQPLQSSGVSILAQTNPDTTTELYKDGEYQGDSVRADHWGNVQVTVVIENGQITDFTINDYPRTRSTSLRISRIAIPYLMQEAIQAQSASIDIVSGATPTSVAFIRSLQSALDDAALDATSNQNTAGSSI